LQSKWALGHFDPSMNRRGATSAFRFESARTRLSYARMKRACLVLGLVVVLGCDEDKRKADLLAKTAPSASVAQPILSAAPSAAPAPSTKPPRECPTGDEVTITDPEIESEVRAKAKKPAPTPLTAKDLATVTSIRINARKGAPLEELDPCVFPKLTSLRFLYLPNGSYRNLSPISNLTRLEGLFFPDSEVEDLKPHPAGAVGSHATRASDSWWAPVGEAAGRRQGDGRSPDRRCRTGGGGDPVEAHAAG